MKPVAAMVAITLLMLVGPLTGAALAAPVSAAPVSAAPAEIAVPESGPLRLTLTDVSPRMVTSTGPGVLTVVGTLTNTGDDPVDELVIRAQRGEPLTTEGAVRDALDGRAGTDAVTPQFTPVPGELAPGEQTPIRLTVPLRGAPQIGLALGATGVYELLVNVNGVPREGTRARLAAVRMLLPVLSLPAEQGATVPDEPNGVPFSLLYPVADTPRRVSTVPGEPTLLTDDDLATALASDGRLGGLVGTLAQAAPPGSRTREAICLAVDPDLVQTAAAMRTGYQFRGPDGAPVPGAGAEVAVRWLEELAAVARTGCVIALPYADADLVALNRGGLGVLASAAVVDGRRVLDDVLQTPSVPGVTWPVDGLTDESTLQRIAEADGRSLVLTGDGVEQGSTQRSAGVLPIAGAPPAQFAVLSDPLLTAAATGSAVRPDPVRGSAAAPASPAGTAGPLSTQDAIGALVFRSRDPALRDADGPLLLAPPHQWVTDGIGARALLDVVDELLESRALTPRPLEVVLAEGPRAAAGARPAVYPIGDGVREVPATVIDAVRAAAGDVADLESAAVPDSGLGVEPDEVFGPLRTGLVRPASAAWRGRPEAADRAAQAAGDRISELRAAVRVLEPPGPYSLGTSNAPILITVSNGLPFTVRVRVEITPSSGLRVAPIEAQDVPPLGRRQVRVSAEVTRSGQFTVQAAVLTPDGELLGPPSRLRVRSTAYGTITLWLTGSAGVLLVVLVARRVLRRIRGEPDHRAEPGHRPPAPPGPPEGRPFPGSPALVAPTPTSPDRAPPTSPDPVPPSPLPDHSPVGQVGDPFPVPHATTDRLPVPRPRPRPDGRPRPPGPPPPRVPSP